MKTLYITSILLMSLTVSCKEGLDRTDLKKLQIKTFVNLNINVEIPKKNIVFTIYDSDECVKNANSRSIYISLHPIYPPKGIIGEPQYLLEVNIQLFSKEQYAIYKTGKHIMSGDEENARIFHDKVTKYTRKHPNGRINLDLYRRDHRNKDDEFVIVAEATYMRNFRDNEKYEEKDIKAIKRILNSIKFIKKE